MPDEEHPAQRVRFDWTGYALLCVSIFCLMYGIANGQRLGWGSSPVAGCFGLGIATGVLFVRSQLRSDRAIFDFSLLSNPRFAAAILVTFIYGAGNFSITYATPVFARSCRGSRPPRRAFCCCRPVSWWWW